jgi:hypothetical protein
VPSTFRTSLAYTDIGDEGSDMETSSDVEAASWSMRFGPGTVIQWWTDIIRGDGRPAINIPVDGTQLQSEQHMKCGRSKLIFDSAICCLSFTLF